MSTTVIKGPAQLEWNGLKIISAGEITVTRNPETFDVKTDAFGPIEERLKACTVTVAFTPSGQWGEIIPSIAAAAARIPGTTVLQGSLVIKPLITPQQVTTIARAGITALPDLFLSASKTLYGQMTFTGIAAVDTTTGAILSQAVFSAPVTAFDVPSIVTEPWTGSYGVPDEEGEFDVNADQVLVGIETEDGWTIKSEMTTEMSRADSVGIVDVFQTGFKVSASCKPVGLTEGAFLEFMQRGGGNELPGMGFALNAGSVLQLNSRSGYRIQLNNAGVKAGSMVWGVSRNRTDGLTFNSIRKFNAGAVQPMLVFTTP